MKMWKSRLAIALAVSTVIGIAIISGCSSDSTEDQTLRIAVSGEPETIDPATSSFGPSLAIARNLFATLLRFDPTTGEVTPYAATETPSRENDGISEDGLTYTFRLRDDAVWEDGRAITAGDFVYGLLRTLDPRVASYYGQSYYAGLIAGGDELAAATEAPAPAIERLKQQVAVKAVDERILQIKLTQPSATFNLLMSLWPAAAVRQDIVEANGDITNSAWTEPGKLLASGPFRLAAWEHGTRIVLEKNPAFWRGDFSPQLARIQLEIIDSESTAYAAYQRGDLDVAPVPIESLGSLAGNPELQRASEATTSAVIFNNTNPQFDEVNERRAFCQAIDRNTLVSEISQGLGEPSTSWLPPSLIPYFDPDRGTALRLNENARRLLGSDNYGDSKLTYANVGPNPVRAEYLQGQWQQRLGVSINVEPLDPPAFSKAFGTRSFDMALVSFSEDYHHPENWLLQWISDNPMNVAGYNNLQFDESVMAAQATEDMDTAVGRWREAESTFLDEDAAICPLMTLESAYLVKPYVNDFVMSGADGIPGDFFWWNTSVRSH